MTTYRIMWNRPGSADPSNKVVIVEAGSEAEAAWKAAERTFDAVHPSGRAFVQIWAVPDITVDHVDHLAGEPLERHMRADHRQQWRISSGLMDPVDAHHAAHTLLDTV